VETLINNCIDKYIKMKQEATDKKTQGGAPANPVAIDNKMEIVIDKMFKRCFSDK
jgi:hypothetical protein